MCDYKMFIWEDDKDIFVMAIDTSVEKALDNLKQVYGNDALERFGQPKIEELSPYIVSV